MIHTPRLVHILITVFCVVVVSFLYVRFLEQRSLFIPYKRIDETPKQIGLNFQDLKILTPEGTILNAWFIPRHKAKETIFFLHGNGGNMSHRLETIRFFHSIGLNVFIFDYRGYGISKGRPSEKGLYADAHAAYRYLTEILNVSPEQVIVYGESLGTAVAVDLAKSCKVKAYILEGAFTSVPEMADQIFFYVPKFFLKTRFDSLSKIDTIDVPKLFIHSKSDEVVPLSMGRRLYERAKAPKTFLEVHGGHNDTFFLREKSSVDKIINFINQLP